MSLDDKRKSVKMNSQPFSWIAKENGFVVVNKAQGVPCQREGDMPSILDYVSEALGQSVFLVHRLDRMTSGVLLLATTPEMNSALSRQFRERGVEKYYFALSLGRPSKKQGSIIGDMKAGRNGDWKLCRTVTNPAITQFFSAATSQGLRLFVLKPYTGRTHQLRVVLKSLGAVVLGDSRYGNQEQALRDAQRLGKEVVDRGYLHCYQLRFSVEGREYDFSCLPEQGDVFGIPEITALMEKYKQPYQLPWPKLQFSRS